jgi:hypothetical protein
MKSFKYMSLRANESAMEGEAKGISQRGHKKRLFLLSVALSFSCVISAKMTDTLYSHEDYVALSQKWVSDAVNYLYANVKDFDREWFFIGAFDDDMEHYQTFTANKSINDVNDSIKRMFNNDLEFTPDTMAYQRITTYNSHVDLALLIVALFKEDYPDMRALRVCNICCPARKHYGSEIKSHYDPEDSVCNLTNSAIKSKRPYEITIYSASLAKRIADFFIFENTLPYVVSSGGDTGYRGVIKRNKLSTKEQKMSFLLGILMRYGYIDNEGSDTYSIVIHNSNSMATLCCDILKEIRCKHVAYVDVLPLGRQIIFTPTVEFWRLKQVAYKADMELMRKY